MWRRGAAWGILLVGIVAISVLTAVATLSTERTFVVSAVTLGASLTFRGEANDWRVERGLLCRAREVPDLRAAAADTDGPCPAASFSAVDPLEDEVLEWRDGTEIRLARAAAGDLRITVRNDATPALPRGSVVVIPADAWDRHGALAFRADAVIGGAMATAADDYLISGHWEARQIGAATALLRDTTETVKSGTLSRGARVEIVPDGDTPVVSFGHLTPTGPDTRGLALVAMSESGRAALRVGYYGMAQPSTFRPDWMDTVSSSPVLIALAVILTLVLTLLELLIAITPARKTAPPDTE